ncbi:helix-turn-helix transcriptional regulator [Methylibium sp.]|uniref:helix-turn-helix transcriptional regulator n=1 Tax=Methylibium sp. TaxID=2067992 RepID=UPI003D0A42C8
MSQAERISRIHFLLKAKDVVSLREMTETFEVSRATLMRDIELMRDRLGAPVVYDATAKGYRLNPNARTGERVDVLPGFWLTAKEGYAFLTMFNVLKAIDPGFLMYFLLPIRSLLKRLLSAQEFTTWSLDEKVAIDLPEFAPSHRRDLRPLFEALVRGEQVRLSWQVNQASLRDFVCHVNRLTLTQRGWIATMTPSDGIAINVPLIDIVDCRGTD